MPLRAPLGTYTRGSMDWFYQDLAICQVTDAGNSFGCDAFLFNDASDGSSFFIYGLSVDASLCYKPFTLGVVLPGAVNLIKTAVAQSVVVGQAAPAGSIWARGDETIASITFQQTVCEANRMRFIDSPWPILVVPPGAYAALNSADEGAQYYNVAYYYLVLKET